MSAKCPLCRNDAVFPATNLGVHGEGLPCEHCGCNLRNRFFYSALARSIGELSVPGRRLKALEVSGYGFARLGRDYVDRLSEHGVDMVCGDYYENNFRAQTKVDLTKLEFADQSFEIIGHSHVLEHIENDDAALRECFRCLRIGGVLVLALPIQTDFTFPVEGEYHGDNALVYRRNGWDLIDKLKTTGFQVEVLAPPNHLAFQNPPVIKDSDYVLDTVRCREKFGVHFERSRALFYALSDASYSNMQKFDSCWGYLEVFLARRPFTLENAKAS